VQPENYQEDVLFWGIFLSECNLHTNLQDGVWVWYGTHDVYWDGTTRPDEL